jgi:hypothetical protein
MSSSGRLLSEDSHAAREVWQGYQLGAMRLLREEECKNPFDSGMVNTPGLGNDLSASAGLALGPNGTPQLAIPASWIQRTRVVLLSDSFLNGIRLSTLGVTHCSSFKQVGPSVSNDKDMCLGSPSNNARKILGKAGLAFSNWCHHDYLFNSSI